MTGRQKNWYDMSLDFKTWISSRHHRKRYVETADTAEHPKNAGTAEYLETAFFASFTIIISHENEAVAVRRALQQPFCGGMEKKKE